jgi:hypothetical protein
MRNKAQKNKKVLEKATKLYYYFNIILHNREQKTKLKNTENKWL